MNPTSRNLLTSLALASATLLPFVSSDRAPATANTHPPQALPVGWSDVLSHLSIVHLDDGNGGLTKTLRVEGVNLQVVNGAGKTDSKNGLGNLIVGYNELRGQDNARTGSHNIVGGLKSNYESYGGQVVGWANWISSPYATVTGGSASRAMGWAASVTGGHSNRAEGGNSTVIAGTNNVATGQFSIVSGGRQNDATGEHAVVAAGVGNEAAAFASSVLGGFGNTTGGDESAILGGRYNTTGARFANVAGGSNNSIANIADVVVGPVTFKD